MGYNSAKLNESLEKIRGENYTGSYAQDREGSPASDTAENLISGIGEAASEAAQVPADVMQRLSQAPEWSPPEDPAGYWSAATKGAVGAQFPGLETVFEKIVGTVSEDLANADKTHKDAYQLGLIIGMMNPANPINKLYGPAKLIKAGKNASKLAKLGTGTAKTALNVGTGAAVGAGYGAEDAYKNDEDMIEGAATGAKYGALADVGIRGVIAGGTKLAGAAGFLGGRMNKPQRKLYSEHYDVIDNPEVTQNLNRDFEAGISKLDENVTRRTGELSDVESQIKRSEQLSDLNTKLSSEAAASVSEVEKGVISAKKSELFTDPEIVGNIQIVTENISQKKQEIGKKLERAFIRDKTRISTDGIKKSLKKKISESRVDAEHYLPYLDEIEKLQSKDGTISIKDLWDLRKQIDQRQSAFYSKAGKQMIQTGAKPVTAMDLQVRSILDSEIKSSSPRAIKSLSDKYYGLQSSLDTISSHIKSSDDLAVIDFIGKMLEGSERMDAKANIIANRLYTAVDDAKKLGAIGDPSGFKKSLEKIVDLRYRSRYPEYMTEALAPKVKSVNLAKEANRITDEVVNTLNPKREAIKGKIGSARGASSALAEFRSKLGRPDTYENFVRKYNKELTPNIVDDIEKIAELSDEKLIELAKRSKIEADYKKLQSESFAQTSKVWPLIGVMLPALVFATGEKDQISKAVITATALAGIHFGGPALTRSILRATAKNRRLLNAAEIIALGTVKGTALGGVKKAIRKENEGKEQERTGLRKFVEPR
jgi:hypothetical protein